MRRRRYPYASWAVAVAGVALVLASAALGAPAGSAGSEPAERPSDGWTIHVDARGHFPGDSRLIAHHWCKPVSGGLLECQLYDSDAGDARMVGAEMIVDFETFRTYDGSEQSHWHYHREEIPAVEATLPDLSPEEAAKVVESLQETYGKVYLFWDPAVNEQPIGQPSVVLVEGVAPASALEP